MRSQNEGYARQRRCALTVVRIFEAIAKGALPEWEFGVQAFDEEKAASLDFDTLDATKIIPEEIIPIEVVSAPKTANVRTTSLTPSATASPWP